MRAALEAGSSRVASMVVFMGSTRTPVEAAGDHGLAIDHSELVMSLAGSGHQG